MYSRTQNENGTYNTRCLDCFMTIASSIETAEELDEREARHICPEKALAEAAGAGKIHCVPCPAELGLIA